MSAHRDPETVADYAKNARMRGLRVIIAGAGLSAALPGRGGRAHRPAGDRRAADLEDRRWPADWTRCSSIAQMPPACPWRRVGVDNAKNAAVLAARILGGVIERYTRPEMGAVWSEQRKLETWLQVELAVVDALAEQGAVPAEDAAAVRERATLHGRGGAASARR